MLIRDKKHFTTGMLLAAVFFGVLAYMFSESFTGAHGEKVNAFHASDNLFNSIAKGSTNYFPRLKEGNTAYKNHDIDLSLHVGTPESARKGSQILNTNGITARADETSVLVQADLQAVIAHAIEDAEYMFNNKGDSLRSKYGLSEKEVLYVWWKMFKSMDIELKHHKDFKAATFVSEVIKRGIEVGYNFYGVIPQSSTSKGGILAFSLFFYVIYTLLWGFAIFYFFEGIGLQMSSGNKKEM